MMPQRDPLDPAAVAYLSWRDRQARPDTGAARMAADAALELRELANDLAAAAAGNAAAAASVLAHVDGRHHSVAVWVRLDLVRYLQALADSAELDGDETSE